MSEATTDQPLYLPIALAVAWPVTFFLVWAGLVDLFGFLGPYLVLMLWLTSAVACFIMAFVVIEKKAWRRRLSTLILPLSALVIFSVGTLAAPSFDLFSPAARALADRVHFIIMRPTYITEISRLPSDVRLIVYNWGGQFLHSRGIVYDESDEIASTVKSEAWKKRAARTDLACPFGYTSLGDHFYFVSFDC